MISHRPLLAANLLFYFINMQLNASLFLFTIITLVGWTLAYPISHDVHMEALSRPSEPYHDIILGLHAREDPKRQSYKPTVGSDDLRRLSVAEFPVRVRKPSKWERVKKVMKDGKLWFINAKKKLGGREYDDELFGRDSGYEIWVRTYPSSEITTRDYGSLDIIGQ
ncbi:hypothetical protein NLI96_g3061 [Meripilus lineatus]|uniref:Uncharacterized protein n=1 Tax=Meripilus lineatus TaxID=2056292 RepID=A0AAD5VCW0_9APHY|nr:hypothetical protein NLI96_g3061 [Physisporinus lineatus]